MYGSVKQRSNANSCVAAAMKSKGRESNGFTARLTTPSVLVFGR
jgi:hypothetical protein